MTKQKTLRQISVKSVKEREGRTVRAILTAPVVDSAGEVFDTQTMQLPLRGGGYVSGKDLDGSQDLNIPIVTNHSLITGGINNDVREVIGRVLNARLNAAGELEGDLYFASVPEGDRMHTLIKEKVLDDCLSLVYWHDGMSSDGVIYNSEIIQLGVVWKSANQRARVLESAKALGIGEADVPKRDAETIKKELAAKQADVEALESELKDVEAPEPEQAPESETPTETQKEETPAEGKPAEEVEKPTDSEDEEGEPEEAKPAEEAQVPTEAAPEVPEKGETPVSKTVAAKAAASKPNTEVRQETERAGDMAEARTIAAKSLQALRAGDNATFARLNKEMEKHLDADTRKFVSAKAAEAAEGRLAYGDIEGTFTQALIDRDFTRLYEEAGGIASRVSKKTLTGNNTSWRKRVKDTKFVFKPAPYGQDKVVQHKIDRYIEFKVQPWAVIAAWDEEAAEDAPFDYLQDVTNDLFEAALDNEEFLIVGFDGGTFKGREYERTGVLAIAAQNTSTMVTQYTADKTFVQTLATALGGVRSTRRNATYSLTMSRDTLSSLAGIQTENGELLFTGAGGTINLGLLGNVNIVEANPDLVPAGQIIVGDWAMYQEVEKGGTRLLGSQHATLDGVSLYQTDGEALRARQRLAGGPLFNEAFHVLSLDGSVTLPEQPTADAAPEG